MLVRYLLFSIVFSFLSVIGIKASQPPMMLWYDKPATDWMTSALPIGNGEFGGMFFGGVQQEQIQFNEKTLWAGSPVLRGAYQNFGDLYLDYPDHVSFTDYRRELSLDNAIGTVSYKTDNVKYKREYFASNPDNLIALYISSPGNKGKLTFSIRLENAHSGEMQTLGNKIIIKGKLDWISYEAQVLVMNDGGTISTDKDTIYITDANAVTILLVGATNYNIQADNYIGESAGQLHQRLTKRLLTASAKGYTRLKEKHLEDYRPKFERVKLDLNSNVPDIPTDVLIESHKESIYLDVLYFQYGRYLMLSSSRGMDLPNNLQGIWNNNNTPPWECDIHTNINVQMNYWPAENTNLSECHMPFLNYIATEALKENGSFSELAKEIGCRGWYVNTQSTIFGHTDWNANRPANAWYCMHLWQHYTYTRDKKFLKETAFPVMKATCEFWFDRLITDKNSKLTAPNEWSPEHGGWEDGVAYSQQLIWELFDQTLKATEIVEADTNFIDELKAKFAKLDDGLAIGEWGQVREWKIQPNIQGNEHRHLSHLIALYPGNQISYHLGKEYADAARVSLESRGDEGTGWSRAWKIACWARLFDGDHAYKLLKAALERSTHTVSKGGVYDNLLDSHPPFQIDGNFGATAGIAEMLLQSNMGFVHLLPALPSVWARGNFSGLRAEGNFTIDLRWENHKATNCTINSGSGELCRIYYPDIKVKSIVNENGEPIMLNREQKNMISFATKKNEKYELLFY